MNYSISVDIIHDYEIAGWHPVCKYRSEVFSHSALRLNMSYIHIPHLMESDHLSESVSFSSHSQSYLMIAHNVPILHHIKHILTKTESQYQHMINIIKHILLVCHCRDTHLMVYVRRYLTYHRLPHLLSLIDISVNMYIFIK